MVVVRTFVIEYFNDDCEFIPFDFVFDGFSVIAFLNDADGYSLSAVIGV